MNSVGILTALHKSAALRATRRLHEELTARGCVVRLTHEAAELIDLDGTGSTSEEIAATDVIIVAGGDGSVLTAARIATLRGTPILPVDLGTFGFLSEYCIDEVISRLDSLLSGDFHIQERAMLHAIVQRPDECVDAGVALNDAVVAKGAFSRIMRFRTYVDDEFVGEYPADGMIVATPTGSTAYALSAGGPVTHPTVEVFLLVPICAHTLFTRPLIIPSTSRVRLEPQVADPQAGELMLTLDGQVGVPLERGDAVEIERAGQTARFVRFHPDGFYTRLRTKLKWGGGL